MTDKYAGLTLGVDVSQVTNAVKSLQQFKKANDDAKSSVEGFVDTEAIARQQAKQLAEELRRQRAEFRKFRTPLIRQRQKWISCDKRHHSLIPFGKRRSAG